MLKARIGIARLTTDITDTPVTYSSKRQVWYHHLLAHFETLDRLRRDGYYGATTVVDDYQGGGQFRRHWVPRCYERLRYEPRQDIRLDVIFDRASSSVLDSDRSVPMVNQAFFEFGHKDDMFRRFSDLQPPTIIVDSEVALGRLQQFGKENDYVVLKGFRGSGGDNVVIDTIGRILNGQIHLPDFPLLAQEFIDSRDGIPGLTASYHDLSVYMIGDSMTTVMVRTPAPGKLLANIKQGGTMALYNLGHLPSEAAQLAQEVNSRLPHRPKVYSVDMLYSARRRRWYFLELNIRVGLLARYQGPEAIYFQDKLATYLEGLAPHR